MTTMRSRFSRTAAIRNGTAAQFAFDGATALALLSCLALSGREAQGQESDPLAAAPESQRMAQAVLEPTEGNDVGGRVEFVETPDGLAIEARVAGLAPGPHGIHIHENGDCSAPDASSAGDHFTPQDSPHGSPESPPAQHHAGDLGNISADDSGNASMKMTDDVLRLDGELGVIGLAVIVHEGEDDLTSQPSGDSGDPVACGVIEAVDSGRG